MSRSRPPGVVPGGPGAPGPAPAPADTPGQVPAAEPFRAGVHAWVGMLGRLRDVVRQEVLASQLASLPQFAGRSARVLDVGCGQGTQALRAARAGHEVTGIDSSPELLARARDLYDGEIRTVDDALRAVVGRLTERGLMAHTVLVVTADHGEELEDHGRMSHGQTVYQELLRAG